MAGEPAPPPAGVADAVEPPPIRLHLHARPQVSAHELVFFAVVSDAEPRLGPLLSARLVDLPLDAAAIGVERGGKVPILQGQQTPKLECRRIGDVHHAVKRAIAHSGVGHGKGLVIGWLLR